MTGVRSALVTGADGFVGSHLVESLLAMQIPTTAVIRRSSSNQVGYRFRNLDEVVTRFKMASDESALKNLQIVPMDLCSADSISGLARCDADVWFHLAADALVTASLNQPVSVVSNNVMSTLYLLEAARVRRPECVVITSSSEVYGGSEDAITESHPLLPRTPYAASKAAAERLAAAYYHTFGVPITIIRPFNSYGPRHLYDFVPLFCYRALLGLPLRITGTGEQCRDLTFVSDLVDAFLALADLTPTCDVFNVGTGGCHSVREIATHLIEMTGKKSEIEYVAPRQGDVTTLRADASHIQERTGWTSRTDLDAGLRKSLEWTRSRWIQPGSGMFPVSVGPY